MASLEDLKRGHARTRPSSSKPPSNPQPKPAADVEGLQRLEFLIEQDQLPEYLRVTQAPPPLWDADQPPMPFARQARREWPLVSRNLSLPLGEWVTWTDNGTIHKVGPHFMSFDLAALWQSLNLF